MRPGLLALLSLSLSACSGPRVSPVLPHFGSGSGRSVTLGQPIELNASWEAYCEAPLIERLTSKSRFTSGSGCDEVEFTFAGSCSNRCEWSLRQDDGTWLAIAEGKPIKTRGAILRVVPLVVGPLSVRAQLRRLDTGEEASLNENGFEISPAPAVPSP